MFGKLATEVSDRGRKATERDLLLRRRRALPPRLPSSRRAPTPGAVSRTRSSLRRPVQPRSAIYFYFFSPVPWLLPHRAGSSAFLLTSIRVSLRRYPGGGSEDADAQGNVVERPADRGNGSVCGALLSSLSLADITYQYRAGFIPSGIKKTTPREGRENRECILNRSTVPCLTSHPPHRGIKHNFQIKSFIFYHSPRQI